MFATKKIQASWPERLEFQLPPPHRFSISSSGSVSVSPLNQRLLWVSDSHNHYLSQINRFSCWSYRRNTVSCEYYSLFLPFPIWMHGLVKSLSWQNNVKACSKCCEALCLQYCACQGELKAAILLNDVGESSFVCEIFLIDGKQFINFALLL